MPTAFCGFFPQLPIWEGPAPLQEKPAPDASLACFPPICYNGFQNQAVRVSTCRIQGETWIRFSLEAATHPNRAGGFMTGMIPFCRVPGFGEWDL